MKKSELKQITGRYGLSPNKKLGQNFLVSDRVADKIIKAIDIGKFDTVLEIGPGLGALTERIIDIAREVTSVEIDSGLVRYLNDRFSGLKNFSLIHGDFLKLEVNGGFTKIVSNLPYYCSSEILFKISAYKSGDAYVMLQKEMAERIVACPGQKSYGALSVTLRFYFEPEILFRVSGDSFYPRPDVASSFMRLKRRGRLMLPYRGIDIFHNVVKSAFWGRRKTILKALSQSPHLQISRDEAERILEKAGIEYRVRGEELGIKDYVKLARFFMEE